jgi:hypothetical protein
MASCAASSMRASLSSPGRVNGWSWWNARSTSAPTLVKSWSQVIFLVEGEHGGRAAFSGHQRLNHGADALYLLDRRCRDPRRLYGDHQCDWSHTCVDRIDNGALRFTVVEDYKVGRVEAVHSLAARVRDRGGHQHHARLHVEARLLRVGADRDGK